MIYPVHLVYPYLDEQTPLLLGMHRCGIRKILPWNDAANEILPLGVSILNWLYEYSEV